MREVSKLIEGLSDEQRRLLAVRLENLKNGGKSGPISRLVKQPRTGNVFPLSFAQQRLWFLDRWEPGAPIYNIPMCFRLRGAVDVGVLEKVVREVQRRHEVFRTRFDWVDERPVQIVCEPTRLTIPVVDLDSAPPSVREAEVVRIVLEEARKVHDLGRVPLIQIRLLRLSPENHLLIFTMHHIISDGWSIGVLRRELELLYHAFVRGKPSPLEELPIQYVDFAVWQRQWLQGEILEKQLTYWKGQLRDAAPVLDFPTDRPRPAIQTFRGGTHPWKLSKKVTDALRALGQREGATLFMTMLAAFQSLLYRYSHQSDIVVGSPIFGRDRTELQGLIGFFVSTLALRCRMDGRETFQQLLAQVREVALGAFAHQDVPFEKLVEELQPARNLSHNPIFQVIFSFQNTPRAAQRDVDLVFSPEEPPTGLTKFDLEFYARPTPSGLSGSFSFNRDLFDVESIDRLSQHFQNLLESIVAQPDACLSELSLPGQDEQRQLVEGWNETKRAYPRHASIQELFERQVQRDPIAVALVCGKERLTYGELNRRANQLGHYLRELGVRVEVPVGLYLERSMEMIVVLLGILKAGGAYVPLDPEYPVERLAFMVKDAGIGVIVTQESLMSSLKAWAGAARIVEPEAESRAIARQSSENPSSGVGAENLAYIIYTSGSTGVPKGVEIVHRSVVRLLFGVDYVELGSGERVLQLAPISFDASTLEVWGGLLHGGRCVVFGERVPTAEELRRVIQDEGVSVLWLTASLYNALVDESPEVMKPVRQLLIGGEALSVEHVRRGLEKLNGVQIINGYGPTEGTTFTCCHRIGREEEDWVRGVPIGRPIGNTEVYLLDEWMNPVPIGVSGELYIGGDGLGRGYVRRAELTAERFVPHPFSPEGGARLYRTGDLCRRGADGAIEFLGRNDAQVKVRGFRIELGEIESALRQQAGVREAVVMVRAEERGDKRLIGYVVEEPGAGLAMGELRERLNERLPKYMVPAVIVALDALPLTPNGKVDRASLPVPDFPSSSQEDAAVKRSPVEEILTGIWMELLGVEQVGLQTNFFDLGGHSLLATRLLSRVRKAFAMEISLRSFFESPTIASLAALIQSMRGGSPRIEGPPVRRVQRDRSLPLSFAQQRLWFLSRMDPTGLLYSIPGAVRLTGNLSVDALERSLNEILRRHEALRTTFTMNGGEPEQVIRPSVQLELTPLDLGLSRDPEGEARKRISEEMRRPFDLETGPLIRANLFRLKDQQHVLLLIMHHIVSDGWSVGVLVRELVALYSAFSKGEPSPLPELSVQYADFAFWQRQWLSGETREKQLKYWKEHLAGCPMVLELPTDFQRPAIQSVEGARETFRIPKQLATQLQQLSRAEGATLFMTLLAAFKVLLMRYSGAQDIVVGSPIANRNREEIEPLIGFFVNTLAIRTRCGDNPSFRGLLGRVREAVLGAFDHQDIPFEQLVEELRPVRDLTRHPLFQVMFALQNAPSESLQLEGLSLNHQEFEWDIAKFDLVLNVGEYGDGLVGSFAYGTRLFKRATIQRMVGHFERLLRGIVESPHAPVSELPMLGLPEILQQSQWNELGKADCGRATLGEMFEEVVGRQPDSDSVVHGEQKLTYEQLHDRANRLARHLRRRGVKVETLVGLFMDRSLEMMVGVLGIVKAGGAYVPLDPAYPAERLEFMLRDSGVKWVLTQGRLRDRLAGVVESIICLDDDWPEIEKEQNDNLGGVVRAENLAYVIYTSGSTGLPKGTMVEHRGLRNLSREQIREFGVGPGSRVLQFSSLSFDAFVFETVMALASGATLVLAQRDELLPGLPLMKLLKDQAVSLITLPPSALALLPTEALPDLATITVAGEACSAELVERWSSGRMFFNLYGPTEATIWSTVAQCVNGRRPPPIGRPIGNTDVYLLDEAMNRLPVGVPGELYIGGVTLARGYLKRPDLTAERFVPHPFSNERGERLYRTGDMCRYREDGTLEFLGRNDAQVKLRGFRIELGEVETALARQSGVKDAVVVVREDRGEKRLVGYVVRDDKEGGAIGALRESLRKQLPEYMVPSVVVELEAMPRTPSGKIDRASLPMPKDHADVEAVAPRTEFEVQIAQVWQDVLGRDRISVADNFFDLGGHSLLLVKVHSQLSQRLNRELNIVELFQYPTIESLARHLSGEASAGLAIKKRAVSINSATEGVRIAIIAMAGRFPGSQNVEEFWRHLRDGVEGIRFFSEEDLISVGLSAALIANPSYVRAAGVLEDVGHFDAGLFGLNAREAEILDPQQRVFLECTWEALERAGYDPGTYLGAIGVFAGGAVNDYRQHVASNPEVLKAAGAYQCHLSNSPDSLATRVSYELGLRGPSLSIQTACSTSLVAVHVACNALRGGECDIALAGGVSISLPPHRGYWYQEGMILSPDGHCRAFDAKAQGTVGGSGVGVVVLKRLEEAQRDGDRILAVIRGSAINNDGSMKVGYTAPSVEGQAEVIAKAQAEAGVEAETITYVEAHGTGTALGDPIEVEALKQAFGSSKRGFCALGSVKSNVGHLDAAAGVTGLIKTVLALEHGQIPASLHYEQANPKIDFLGSPFYVNTGLREWERVGGQPRRAGVSSFGIGGTNAHVVLEEGPEGEESGPGRGYQVLVYSGRSAGVLEKVRENLVKYLKGEGAGEKMADVAYTLGVGRKRMEQRQMVVVGSREEAVERLGSGEGVRGWRGEAGEGRRGLVMVVGGQALEAGVVGKELYEGERVYRERVKECGQKVKELAGVDVEEEMYGKGRMEGLEERGLRGAAEFAVGYGLVGLWESLGVEVEGMMGMGIGEYVAGCWAGVMSVEEGLRLVIAGGKRAGEEYEQVVRGVKWKKGNRRYVSGASGKWVGEEAGDWMGVWRGEKKWEEGLRELRQGGVVECVELGMGEEERRKYGEGEVHGGYGRGAGKEWRGMVETVGELWLRGVTVEWNGYYGGEKRKRVLLPTYPFERQRYWVEAPVAQPSKATAGERGIPKLNDRSKWLHVPSWNRGEPLPLGGLEGPSIRWLIFDDDMGLGEELIRELKSKGQIIARVRPGNSFLATSEDEYSIRPGAAEDYQALFTRLVAQERTPDRIVHLWNTTQAGEEGRRRGGSGARLERGFYSLTYLVQALGRANVTHRVELNVVGNHWHEVVGGEVTIPEKAMMLGLCRVIPQEQGNIACRSIEVDLQGEEGARRSANLLVRELAAAPASVTVAHRGKHRWLQTFCPMRTEAAQDNALKTGRLRKGGVYVITGGLGGIGILLAEYLAREAQAKLVLIGRSGLPPTEQWADWRLSHGSEDRTSRRITAVQAIERLGGEVLVLEADVANAEQMAAALSRAERRFGTIHGFIHAAGVTNSDAFEGIQKLSRAICEQHFHPKIDGVRCLSELLKGRKFDFCLLMSSLSSVLGGMGFGAYAAANAYMDAFAQQRCREDGSAWISVLWDGWELDRGVRRTRGEGSTANLALTPSEGMDIFSRIVTLRPALPVVVSTGDLQARLDQWVHFHGGNRGATPSGGEVHSRPEQVSAFVAPRDALEQKLAEIWQHLFNLERVGIHDDFLDLGGSSLTVIQMLPTLKEALGVELTVQAVLEAPTIAQMAAAISKEQKAGLEGREEIEGILQYIEQMSDHEAKSLLKGQNRDGSDQAQT